MKKPRTTTKAEDSKAIYAIDPGTIEIAITAINTAIKIASFFRKKSDDYQNTVLKYLDEISGHLDEIDGRLEKIERAIAELGVLLRREHVNNARISLNSIKEIVTVQYPTWVDIKDEARGAILLKLSQLQEAMLTVMTPERGGYAHALLIADAHLVAAQLMVIGRSNPSSVSRSFSMVDRFFGDALNPNIEGSWANKGEARGVLQEFEAEFQSRGLGDLVAVTHQWRHESEGQWSWERRFQEWGRVTGSISSGFSKSFYGYHPTDVIRNKTRERPDRYPKGATGDDAVSEYLVPNMHRTLLSKDVSFLKSLDRAKADGSFPRDERNTDRGHIVLTQKLDAANGLARDYQKALVAAKALGPLIDRLKVLRQSFQKAELDTLRLISES